MSHLSSLFTKVPVDIPNRSGFDLSHESIGTMKVGTLTPVLCEELLPNDTISLGILSQITLPPMATDFYGRVDLCLEAFFVPNRILWAGWERFMTLPISNPWSSSDALQRSIHTPAAIMSLLTSDSVSSITSVLGPGTLTDYLGMRLTTDSFVSNSTIYYVPSLLPYLAYHKIYDEYYRDSRVQTPLFGNDGSSTPSVYNLPYYFSSTSSLVNLSESFSDVYNNVEGSLVFPDGVNVFSLRQRNWAKDYFTTAHLYPQANDSVSGVSITSSDTASDVTIPDLRAANVIQRWIERNNIAGTRYSDQLEATYGVKPSDAILDRPVFLGHTKFGIYNKSVYNTNSGAEASNSSNPFYSTGSSGAACKGLGDNSLVDKFTTTEHGYLIVLASVVPHLYFGTGSRRYLYRTRPFDFANPLLQGLGEQPIFNFELSGDYDALPNVGTTPGVTDDSGMLAQAVINAGGDGNYSFLNGYNLGSSIIFGYTQQYAEYKYHEDEVHGLLRDGENLQYFALQASYDDPELSSEFLQIPTNYMDNVTAVTAALSDYGAWYDFYFKFKKISTLSEYVIPTLGDIKNTHKERIDYNGRRL